MKRQGQEVLPLGNSNNQNDQSELQGKVANGDNITA
jgi:hypothetical protein